MIILSQLTFKRLNFVRIFFYLRKSPEVILGHLGPYGVKFRTSAKVDKLCLKMKLLARALKKSSHWVIKGKKIPKKGLNGQILIFLKSRQITPQNEALDESFMKKSKISAFFSRNDPI